MAAISKRKWTTSKGEVREAYVLAYTDQTGRRFKEQFAKKKEAEARLPEVLSQIDKRTFRVDAKTKTVADAIKGYVELMKQKEEDGEKARMYVTNIKGLLANHVEPKIGKVTLSDLSASRVDTMLAELKAEGVGVPTVRRVAGTLSRVLKFAGRKDWIAVNVAHGAKVDAKRGEGSEKVVPPSKAVFAAILKAADTLKQPDLRLRIIFAASTGLRASELWALKWGKVDLEARLVTVDTRVDGFGKFETTKSKAGIRTIRLSKQLAERLAVWKEAKQGQGDDFVFPNTDGGHTRHDVFTRWVWNKVIEKAEAPGLGFHSLRHFAVSTWIAAGLQPKEVQTLAGHATYAITMDRYGHMFPTMDHGKAMDGIASELYE